MASAAADHPLAIGVDLVEIARVRRLLVDNPRAWLGLSTAKERICWRGVAGAACLLAVKEAVVKALNGPGADEIDWHEIEVSPGPPLRIEFSGDLEKWTARYRPGPWLASASASATLAVAWVLRVPAVGGASGIP